MRIVLVSAVPPPEGGIATWTKKYIEYCKKNKIDLQLVNTALLGSRGKKINSKRKMFDEFGRTYYILKNMKSSILKRDIDVVHLNSSCSNIGIIRDYLCIKMAYKCEIPIVLHCHCNVEDQVTKKISHKILGKICKMSSVVLTLNRDSFDYIKKEYGIDSKIIPNFVDEDMVCEKHLIRKEIKEAVFVGHVQKTKGCSEIIEVANCMKDIHFTLIGPVSDEINNLFIPENVSLVGVKNSLEIRNYLSKADVFVFPSYTEGFSLSLTEAMANGLPCIATDVGANRDMLEEYGGCVVPVKNCESIISAIHQLEDIEVRKKASLWNLKKVKTEYLPDTIMKSIMSIYNRFV